MILKIDRLWLSRQFSLSVIVEGHARHAENILIRRTSLWFFRGSKRAPCTPSPSINSINCISLLSNCIRHMSSTLRGPVLSFREHRHIPGNNYLTRDYRLKFGEYRKINRFGNGEKDMWVNDTNLKCSFLPRD